MCRLLETMMIVDGVVRNAQYHNARLNTSRRELFHSADTLDVRDLIPVADGLHGLVRCRMIYAETVLSVECEPYLRQPIRSLQLLRRDDISYPYKFAERSQFAEALRHRNDCDDVLIVKQDRITDTSFSNVAFFLETEWVTPAAPLLKGTMRASLLDRGMIVEDDVRVADLKNFSQIMLINALRDFNLRETISMRDLDCTGILRE
jgi:4-amino-4-deoxychorismate lyase